MDIKVKNIVEFYRAVNKLKDVIRKGWLVCGIDAKRLESIMEHTNSCQYLAMAIKSQYPEEYKNVNLERVIMMFTVHDMEEAIIPDFTPMDKVTKEQKRKMGKAAVEKLLAMLGDPKENPIVKMIADLINEYNAGETVDARFAKQVDSLDSGLQCKMYDEKGQMDLTTEKGKLVEKFHKVYEKGFSKLSDAWICDHIQWHNYDTVFTEIANKVIDQKPST